MTTLIQVNEYEVRVCTQVGVCVCVCRLSTERMVDSWPVSGGSVAALPMLP